MEYKIITQKLEAGKNYIDIFATKCNNLLKEGWEPYSSVSIERSWYSDQSGPSKISQAFIQTNKNSIKEYCVVYGQEIDKDVTLLLYKGWKLYGNLVSVPTEGREGLVFYQVCIREVNKTEEKSLIDFTN